MPVYSWACRHVRELHGPSFSGLGPGWLVDLVVQDSAGQPLPLWLYSDFIERLNQLFPGLDLEQIDVAGSGPKDGDTVSLSLLSVLMARRLMAPIQVESVAVASTFRPDVESHLLQGHHHDLVGASLKLAVQMLVLSLDHRGDDSELIRVQLVADVGKIAAMANYLSRHAFTNAVVAHAHQRGLALWLLGVGRAEWPILQLGTGNFSRLVCSTACDADSMIAAGICRQKVQTNQILSRLGFPVPRQYRLSLSSDQAKLQSAVDSVGYPCVVKPCDAEQGRGVTIGITNLEALQQALERAQEHTRSDLLVEQHVEGHYHRMVVIAKQLVRVLRLEPPYLIGDGQGSVTQLLDQVSRSRMQEGAEEYVSTPVKLDDAVLATIADQGYAPDDILPAGVRVVLSADLENRSNWIYGEWLDRVHPSLAQMAVAIAESLGISNLGVDVISTDITRPLQLGCTKLIELNAIQTLNPRWAPVFVDRLLPPERSCHIPLHVVICVDEADWPDRSWIERQLRLLPGCSLAFPARLASQVDVENLSSQWTVVPYSHPREPLMNRSLAGLLFLLDWREFLASGLPAAQGLVHVELLGSLPARQAAQWQRFCKSLPITNTRQGPEGFV